VKFYYRYLWHLSVLPLMLAFSTILSGKTQGEASLTISPLLQTLRDLKVLHDFLAYKVPD